MKKNFCYLLWIEKVRVISKTYEWGSVRWETWCQQARNPRIRWVSTRSRHDGKPTDTQTDTQPKDSSVWRRPLSHVVKKTLHWGGDHWHGTVTRAAFLKLKQKSEAPQRKPRPHVPTQIPMRRPPCMISVLFFFFFLFFGRTPPEVNFGLRPQHGD